MSKFGRWIPLAMVSAGMLVGGFAVVTQPFVDPVVSKPPAVNAARLEAVVKHLSVDLFPRSQDQARNMALAAKFIASELAAAGADVEGQDVVAPNGTFKNIVARFGHKTGPVMVIGAHYDAHGHAIVGANGQPSASLETHTPGADDSASGVAGPLELARLLGQTKQTRSIELVAYALEEPSHFRTEHMGSAWHARAEG